jgi:hypothetical protein
MEKSINDFDLENLRMYEYSSARCYPLVEHKENIAYGKYNSMK